MTSGYVRVLRHCWTYLQHEEMVDGAPRRYSPFMHARPPILTVRNLRLACRGSAQSVRPLLSIDCLDLHAGEILGLVGPSGSGKSLFAMSLMGLVREQGISVDGGTILFDGIDMLDGDERTLDAVRGRRISLAFQEPLAALDPAATVRAQLAEPLRTTDEASTPAQNARIVESLAAVGLPCDGRVLNAFPRHDLSGGERQRLLLGLATMLHPDVLIADEPSTQLDPILKVQVGLFLRRLKEERGTASILISHDEGLVRSVADRVIRIRDGRLVPSEQSVIRKQTESADPPEQLSGRVVLEATGLAKYHGRGRRRTAALRDVDLTLHESEFLGVMGASGAGKTTLMRCLAGLTRIDEGTLTIAGRSAERRHPNAVQMIYQDPGSSLDPLMAVGKSIAEGMGRGRQSSTDRREEVLRLMDRMGLPHAFYDRLPRDLSGGERQRVAIARALAAKPAIMIADEPTSALDYDSASRVVEALHTLRVEQPATACVIVSHDLDLLSRLCSSVLVMHGGRIIEKGRMSDVLTFPATAAARELIEASKRLSLSAL